MTDQITSQNPTMSDAAVVPDAAITGTATPGAGKEQSPHMLAWLREKLTSVGHNISVPLRLNMLNMLVLISGLLSIFGVYEIQLGGQMHKLNYQHQKYITELGAVLESYEAGAGDAALLRDKIMLVRQQPVACLEMIGRVERAVLWLVGTADAIRVCEDDEALATNLIEVIDSYEAGRMSRIDFLASMNAGIEGFINHGVEFQPVVDETVRLVFLAVITMVIAKAFLVPLMGLLLSSSVSRDYKTLTETKSALVEAKKHSDMIQAEKMQAMSTMVAGIAHEINTPVGISVTAASHAKEALLKTQQRYKQEALTEEELSDFFQDISEALGIVQSNLSRTSDLVRSFKQVSVDRSHDEIRPVRMKAYISDILISLRPVTKTSKVQVALDCPQYLIADIYPGAFSQIVTNLVTNSIKHGFKPDEKGQITIGIKPAGDRLAMTYHDDGVGIRAEDIKLIFNPFFTTRRGAGGTGLGLHILHNLVVDQMEGTVTCESEPGAGTRFTISFPCQMREERPYLI